MGQNDTSDKVLKIWIIQSAFRVFWHCRAVVALALGWMVVFVALDAVLPRPGLLDPDGGAISAPGAIRFVLRFLIDALAVIVVAFCAHAVVLNGGDGWAVLRASNRAAVFRFCAGFLGLAVLIAVMALIYQQFFVADVLRLLLGSGDVPANTGRLAIGAVILVGFLGLIALTATWGGAVVCDADQTLRGTWARGRRTFWFVLGWLVAVLLVFPIISTLIVPVMAQAVAVLTLIGIPVDWAFAAISTIFSGAIICFGAVLLSVISARAFIIALK